MLHLRNQLLPLLRAASPLLSPIHRRLLSASAAAPFSLEDYLVAACGLSPAQARKASKQAFQEASTQAGKPFEEFRSSRLNTASNPDAIIALLSSAGLSRADIAAVVAADPLILRSCVNNIAPRLLALRDRIGLSPPQIARLLLADSRALRNRDVFPKLEFLISSFGSLETVLAVMKANKKSRSILSSSLDGVIKPNMEQFRQWGLSARDIAQMCLFRPWLIGFPPELVKDFMLRAEDLGVSRGSPMFKYMIAATSRSTTEKNAATLELLKRSLGCSKSEAASAVSKTPSILGTSDECLLAKIQFLINEVGLEPQYILQRPSLLTYSLEKRLVPRHRVIKILRAKGLTNINFASLVFLGEKKFRLNFVDRHKDSISGLADAYAAACAGLVPV